MILFLIIGGGLVLFGLLAFAKAIYLFALAFYYRYFATEKQLDNAYYKKVLSKTKEYSEFEDDLNGILKD